MSNTLPLLIELGTEELPPKALPELAQAFFDGIVKGLEARKLLPVTPVVEHSLGSIEALQGKPKPLYSPRRLAVLLPEVCLKQAPQRIETLGPYLNVALDEAGQPTQALIGFAQKNGLAVEQLERVTDAKGMRFVARSVRPGASTAELLPEIITEAIKAMPTPKPMRWGDNDFSFVRPAHWLVILLGKDIVSGSVLGLGSTRMSRGHRFHHDKQVWINEAGEYIEAMRGAFVLVDADERRRRVRQEIESAAREAGGNARIEPDLLEEVNCLVEWPKAVLCNFEKEFLAVPQEALITTMESNQKFFPVLDSKGKLTEHFIGVANIESKDPSEVRKGYERVIRPRFADAKFFFDEDLKQGIAKMAVGLGDVTYQQKLGSYADKSLRVADLAVAVATGMGSDPELARSAAKLAKADLQSRMVGEFPELQGIAGRYYAQAAGLPPEVAVAIDEAYRPRFSADAIASSKLGQVLAIAERLDTLAGGFAAGLRPSGNKDPFALRRHALGLARTLIGCGADLDLAALLQAALAAQPVALADAAAMATEVHAFIMDRLRSFYADQDIPGIQFDAVLASPYVSLPDFDKRLRAIGEFAKLSAAATLAAANKRIRNILKKNETVIPDAVDPSLFTDDSERALHAAIEAAITATDPLLSQRDYVATLKHMTFLRAPVDEFFQHVMVMDDNIAIRGNRLAMIKRLADRFSAVAEIALLSQA